MARKKIGDVELQWNCPNCGGVNPGSQRLCGNCGAPQPANVKFQQAARQELIAGDAKKAQAAAGADIHCPYCGARNPAGTKVCNQCGGDLSEGAVRQAGQVLGAFKTGPMTMVKCLNCGSENLDTNLKCTNCGAALKPTLPQEIATPQAARPARPARPNPLLFAGIGVVVLILCGLMAYLIFKSNKTEAFTGTVQSVRWERTIPIEAIVPVQYDGWQDQIPSGAEVGACREEIRFTSDEQQPNSVEVCGTPYTVDTGGGYGEVVQDCEYQVYDQYCDYAVEEWHQVDAATLSGSDFSPGWPEPVLQQGQRIGEDRNETYTIVFNTGGETFVYKTSDFGLFQQAQIGSDWALTRNGSGDLISIEP